MLALLEKVLHPNILEENFSISKLMKVDQKNDVEFGTIAVLKIFNTTQATDEHQF